MSDVALGEVTELAGAAKVAQRTDRFAIVTVTDTDLLSIRTRARTVDDVRILVAGPARIATNQDLTDLCGQAAANAMSLAGADGRGGSGAWSVTVSARNPVWRHGAGWDPAEVFAHQLHGADMTGTQRQPVDLRIQVDEDRAHLAINLAVPDNRHRGVPLRPGALRPSVAAAMIRLAIQGLPATMTRLGIYDPFCGSGTVLAEAALAGLPVFGSDIDRHAVEMTRQRLAAMARDRRTTVVDVDHLRHRIFEHDVTNGVPARVLAGVLVSNLPWGKQVRIGRHQELFDAACALVAAVLDRGGAAVLLATNEDRIVARVRKQVDGAEITTRRIGLLGQTPAIVSVRPDRAEHRRARSGRSGVEGNAVA